MPREVEFSLTFDESLRGTMRFEDDGEDEDDDGNENPPPPNGGGGSWAYIPMAWKAKGTSIHPDVGSGDLTGRYFRLGNFVHLQVHLQLADDTQFGASAPFYYFQPGEEIAPDFDGPALEAVGVANLYASGRGPEHVGICKWSKNVGSGIDGIRVVFGDSEFSQNHPVVLRTGDRLRLSLPYEVP